MLFSVEDDFIFFNYHLPYGVPNSMKSGVLATPSQLAYTRHPVFLCSSRYSRLNVIDCRSFREYNGRHVIRTRQQGILVITVQTQTDITLNNQGMNPR